MDETATLFELLTADTRRRILFALCDSDSLQLPTGILPRGMAPPDNPQDTHADSLSGDSSSPDNTDMHDLLIQAHHIHLPKLEDAELILWDRDTRTVSRGPRFEDVEPALRLLASNQERFPDDLL